MTFTVFEVSDADISSSSKGENTSMAFEVGSPADQLYRHQNLASIKERVISFCTLTRSDRGHVSFNNYSPPAGFTWNEKLSFAPLAIRLDSGSVSSPI
jgi:hypothetical protein